MSGLNLSINNQAINIDREKVFCYSICHWCTSEIQGYVLGRYVYVYVRTYVSIQVFIYFVMDLRSKHLKFVNK